MEDLLNKLFKQTEDVVDGLVKHEPVIQASFKQASVKQDLNKEPAFKQERKMVQLDKDIYDRLDVLKNSGRFTRLSHVIEALLDKKI